MAGVGVGENDGGRDGRFRAGAGADARGGQGRSIGAAGAVPILSKTIGAGDGRAEIEKYFFWPPWAG